MNGTKGSVVNNKSNENAGRKRIFLTIELVILSLSSDSNVYIACVSHVRV